LLPIVIEKCIINASDHEINMIAAEVLAPGLDGNTGIQAMLRHEVREGFALSELDGTNPFSFMYSMRIIPFNAS
jgi:hypothetical protein